jgi:hypothetical protein
MRVGALRILCVVGVIVGAWVAARPVPGRAKGIGPRVLVPFVGANAVMAREEGGDGTNRKMPPGTKCLLIREVSTTNVLVEVEGERYWVYRGNVRPPGGPGTVPPPEPLFH